MNIPKYWTKETYTGQDNYGEQRSTTAWGWSSKSMEDARQLALETAARIYKIAFVTGPNKKDEYNYLNRPLREEIINTFGPEDNPTAIITRNIYGALVLNCSTMCFVDIDFPRLSDVGILKQLIFAFSSAKKEAYLAEQKEKIIYNIRHWHATNPDHSFRMYCTAAGLRLLFTDREYDPASDEVSSLLKSLGSDPLYRRLTLAQKSFRARLTPKPWRCDIPELPCRYPCSTEQDKDNYNDWIQSYEKYTYQYATCELIETLGTKQIFPDFESIIDLHDSYTIIEGKKLA